MKLFWKVILITGFITTIFSITSLAQEDLFFIGNKIGIGSRALGLGGAYTALADDYSAIYYNPAGLGQIRRMEFNLGYSHTKSTAAASFFGEQSKTDNSFTRMNSIGFVLPVPTYQGSLVFAFGYNKPHDFDDNLKIAALTLPGADYDSLYQEEQIWSEGDLKRWSLAGALEVQKNIFLGLGIDLYTGKEDYNVKFTETDPYGLYVIGDYPYDYRFVERNITTDYSGIGLNIGALFRMNSVLSLGAMITSPKTLKLKEKYESLDETHVINDVIDPIYNDEEGRFEYKIQEPYKISLGSVFSPWLVTFTGDLEFQDWTQAKFKTDPPVAGISKQEANLRIKDVLRLTTNVRLGAEVIVPFIRTRLRGGLAYMQSPYKSDSNKIDINNLKDKVYVSLGIGMLLDKQVMLDLVFLHGQWKAETMDDLTEGITIEDRQLNRIMGTLSMRF